METLPAFEQEKGTATVLSLSREACRGRTSSASRACRIAAARVSSPIESSNSPACVGHVQWPQPQSDRWQLDILSGMESGGRVSSECRTRTAASVQALQKWIRPRDRARRGRSPQRTDFFRGTTAKRLGLLQLRQDGEQRAGPASATEDLSASITPRNNTIGRCIEIS